MSLKELLETISAANGAMILAADESRWDDLIQIAGARTELISNLQDLLKSPASFTSEEAAAAKLMREELLDGYGSVTQIISSRMDQLKKSLLSNKNSDLISQYYEHHSQA